jgi:transposase
MGKFFDMDGQNLTVRQSQTDMQGENYGYFVLFSSHIETAESALAIYRNKDVVEKTFCNLKNRLDMNRTKASTEETLEGKLFVQFIALVFVAYIHRIMSKNNLYKNYPIETFLDELDVIEIFGYQTKKANTSEITRKQLWLLSFFDCKI